MLPKTGGETLVITKSLKDCMLLYELGIPAIAPCSENLFVSQKQFEKLKNKFKNIFLFYDNDQAGISNMNKIRKQFPGLIVTFIPRHLEAKDISDFYFKYGKKRTIELINKAKEHYLNGKESKSNISE
jgi:DNA primase